MNGMGTPRCFYLHGVNNHSTSTAVVFHADTGRLALTYNVMWINRRAGAPAPVPGIGRGSSVAAAPSPATAVPAAEAAPPPPSRRYTYVPPAPATTAPPPPASPPIFTGSLAPSPISVAPSSAPPSTATTPPHSPPSLPPPPPQPTSAATPAPPHPPLSKRAVKELGRKHTRVHGRTRGNGVRFVDEQQQPLSPTGGGAALHHRLGLLAMMDKDFLIPSLGTREAVDRTPRHTDPAAAGSKSWRPWKQGGRGSWGPRGFRGGGGRPQTFQPVENAINAKWFFNCKGKRVRMADEIQGKTFTGGGHAEASIDFGELFAPTVSSVRLLAALACEQNLDLCHIDIQQAFVQSELDEDVFMRLPQGCGRLSGLIVKLWKSLYGLKQASRLCHAHLTRCLSLFVFLQCLAGACVFRLMEEGHVIMIHVDDVVAAGQKERCDKCGRDINEMVPVKNLGELRWTSWMGITFERGVVTGCVTWFSRTQKCVTLSTTEVEYVAIADVLNKVLFLRQVWRFMLPDASMPCIPAFEDNQGALQIAHNPITNSNSNHIGLRHHFIRELVDRKEISITHVPTKAISKESFALHREFVINLQ
ncbi:unnamed protein product [Ectocarpus sp. CCAP 1310/34]|nr:unnamed protein product [Ectocarpus sp. CCAP 1310/34]